MTRVYLLRHGQTVWNSEGRAQGQLDSDLTALGQVQAACLARVLAGVPLRAVYSSPLTRALDTARAIAAPHGLTVAIDPDLREIGMGAWEGLTSAQISDRYGDVLSRRRRDPLGVVPPGGESLVEVQARVMRAMQAILGRHPGAPIAVVAHGAVNRMLLLSVLEAPLTSYWRLRQDNAAINVVEFDGDRRWVRAINETGHLADARREPPASPVPGTATS